MPSKGTEVAVTPTHVVSADRMYVQLTDGIKRFEEFQYTTLKKVQLQPLNYIPSKLKREWHSFWTASINGFHFQSQMNISWHGMNLINAFIELE